MRINRLDDLSDHELVVRFATLSQERGEAVISLEPRRANRVYAAMYKIDQLLRRRGRTSRLELAILLGNENPFTRYYAALKLLALLPQESRRIIEWATDNLDLAIAADARHVLRALDTGEFKPT